MAFYRDRVAIVAAVIGAVLMALSVAWRVNPVEGGVMPSFLKAGVGMAVGVVLIVTSIPTWIVGAPLVFVLPAPLVGPGMVLVSAVLYFGLGEGLSLAIRRLKGRTLPVEPLSALSAQRGRRTRG